MLTSEIEALIDHSEFEKARTAFQKAADHMTAMQKNLRDAQAALAKAEKVPGELAERIGAGESVTSQQRLDASTAIGAAQAEVAFFTAAVASSQKHFEAADLANRTAPARAYAAAFSALIDKRISAAARADAARQAVADAEDEYRAVRRQMDHLRAVGAVNPYGIEGEMRSDMVGSERMERFHWKRPVDLAEAA